MSQSPLVINGWTIFADPCFLESVAALQQKVLQLRKKHPETWVLKNSAKRLAMIVRLILKDIPEDPTRDIYRQGLTLGNPYKHWRRAKFYQQYRLFFRYHSKRKIIVIGWVNDPDTKRAYDSKADVYKVFKKMLESGHPPNNWDELLKGAKAETERLKTVLDDI